MNLTAQQWDLLRSLVINHESTGGAEFYFTQSHTGAGISYAGIEESINSSETDLYQLRNERLVTLVTVSQNIHRGKPTQLGITTVHRSLAVADEPARQTVASDSAFWRNRREEFDSLPPGEYSLRWSTPRATSLAGELLPSQWSWSRFPDESLMA